MWDEQGTQLMIHLCVEETSAQCEVHMEETHVPGHSPVLATANTRHGNQKFTSLKDTRGHSLLSQGNPEEQVQRGGRKVFPGSIQGFCHSLNNIQLWRPSPTQFLILVQKYKNKITQ
jgi:hypothetical protein